MISIKGAKWTICGIAGLWLVNKVINASGIIVQKILDERKWHAYYKYAGEVPPGYASTTVPHKTYDVKYSSPEQQEEERKEEANANKKPVDVAGIVDGAKSIFNEYLKAKFGHKSDAGDTDGDEDIEDVKVEVPAEEVEESRGKITELFSDGIKVGEIPEEDDIGEDEDK